MGGVKVFASLALLILIYTLLHRFSHVMMVVIFTQNSYQILIDAILGYITF